MTEISLDANRRVTIIDDVLQKLHDHYICPKVAQPSGPLEELAHEARAALAALKEETTNESQVA